MNDQGTIQENEAIRVLVVDDEFCIRGSLVAFLEDEDMEISSAGSAEEALELLREADKRKKQYHCAVVDLRLPGISGDTFILNAHKMFSHIHYIIHTGSSSYQLSEDLKQIGMQPRHVFIKPLKDLRILTATIKELIVS